MFLELVILLVAAVFAFDYFRKKRRSDLVSFLQGPDPLPILGSVILLSKRTPEILFTSFLENREKYGSMYRVWVLNRLLVICSDPKDVEVVLSSNKLITKDSLYNLLIGWLGTGLLISTGQKWHSRRKVLTPAFHFKILEQFVEIFDQQSSILVEKIRDQADGKTAVDMYPYVGRLALDIIAETSMGTKVNAQDSPNFGYVQAVADISSIISKRIINGWYRLRPVYRLLAPELYRREQETIKKLHAFTENVIRERRDALEKRNSSDNANTSANEEIGGKKRMALLDVLLQAEIDGKPLSNADIREEVDTFMFEGHDTTTIGISFTLFLLSRHSDIQKKAFEEIREVLGEDPNRSITLNDLNNLKYLECVIKEGLRLFPPVPLIGRRFSEDVLINGRTIPAHCDFTVAIFVMLRDPEYFHNPNEFIPERHTGENLAEKSNPYAYIPFSAGPRNCIGQKFAILEMKSTISKILRNYELLPLGPEVRPMISVILRSANGAHMGLKPRI